MRILILGINYFPEPTSVSPFTTGLAEHLAAQDHSVQVVTAFPYYPEWRIWREYRGRVTQEEVRHGVRIRRVRHFVPRRPSSLIQRLLHDFSFSLTAFLAGLNSAECDIIYCSSPPPALAVSAYLLSKWKRVPYVIKLTDLASDAALATGILNEGRAVKVARALEDFVYWNAEAVFCLCEAFIDKLTKRGIPPAKLRMIPDWGDTENIRPVISDGSFHARHGIRPGQFLALHTGNMGKKQDLLNIVRAAELTNHDQELVWMIVGQGEERPLIETEIAKRKLTNLRLLPLQPAEIMCQMYAAADVLILNQKAAVKDAVIPSKLLTYMSAGRPVLASVSDESETARQVRKAQCGIVVAPEDAAALVEGVSSLRAEPSLRHTLGRNGCSYVDANFTKARVLRAYDEYFGLRLKPRPMAQSATSKTILPPVDRLEPSSKELSVPSSADQT
jgi:colanic acid biosynthesis glycosyl transferase WcaI